MFHKFLANIPLYLLILTKAKSVNSYITPTNKPASQLANEPTNQSVNQSIVPTKGTDTVHPDKADGSQQSGTSCSLLREQNYEAPSS
jgi:hypothetical protein